VLDLLLIALGAVLAGTLAKCYDSDDEASCFVTRPG
jgi:hypothetical protein